MSSARLDWEQMERKAMVGLLGALVVYSVLCATFSLSLVWQMPAVFGALMAILKVALEIRERTDADPAVSVEHYDDNAEFYSAMWSRISKARRSVEATYIRRIPPTRFVGADASAYFAKVIEWAREDPSRRSMRRIIAVPDDAMLTWARTHDAETCEVGNYEVRVLAWQIRADSLNMCVIDRDTENASVFLAFSGETEQAMSGLYIRGGWAVDYFARYYSQLWQEAKPLSAFIADRGAAG